VLDNEIEKKKSIKNKTQKTTQVYSD
jgi:hypothetical protein